MSDDGGLDLVGAGKLAKAIPAKAWVQLVDTACTTFKAALAPLTATTSGIGRLVEAKFDRLIDAEKILAAETMKRATEKMSNSKHTPSGTAKANIVIAVVESSANETEPILRELWANLLAQELVSGTVHPEIPKVLARLSSSDAQLLAQIAERGSDKSVILKRALKQFTASISILGLAVDLASLDDANSFAHEHLGNLHLIRRDQGVWGLTRTGEAFIEAVTDSWGSAHAV